MLSDSSLTTLMTAYRRSVYLFSAFWLFFAVDALLFFFSPLLVFLLFLLVHVGLYFAVVSARCQLLNYIVGYQSAVKNCAPEPEARREASEISD